MEKSKSFTIAYWMLLAVLAVDLIPYVLFGKDEIFVGGIGLDGLVRFIALGVLVVILIDHLTRFSFVFRYERKIVVVILLFFLIMLVQLFWVNQAVLNLQGAVKFIFYFCFIVISLYSAIIYSDTTIQTIINISLYLFLAVLAFYPYLIVTSGQNIVSRFFDNEARMHFLLKAGNEDAHFMTTLMMLVFLKLKKNKVILIAVGLIFYVALVYNGTRSALFMALVLPVLYYIFYKKRFVASFVIIVLVTFATLPYMNTLIEAKFSKDLKVFQETDKVMAGEKVGGNMSWRITHVWLPTVHYTWDHAPFTGNGSNGWNIVGAKVISGGESASPHNLFIWAFVNWGLIGACLLLALMGIPILYVWRSYWQEDDPKDLAVIIALLCGWLEFIVWSSLANSYNLNGWVVLSLLIVCSIAVKYKDFCRNLMSVHESFNYKHV